MIQVRSILLHPRQLTNESVAAKAFEVHRDTKLHEWVSDPCLEVTLKP